MIRRSHKKSRNGCTECKRGHRKCDEARPVCGNCTLARKQCSYSGNGESKSSQATQFINSTSLETPNGPSSPQPMSEAAVDASPPLLPVQAPLEPEINFLHLELYQNMSTDAMSFSLDTESKELWTSTILRYTFKYPYLMYEMLAISALNLSVFHPSKAEIYLAESTALQTKALSLFNASPPLKDLESINAAFLFSGGLGLHVFCSTFSTPSPDLNTFLDRLVQSMSLLRGIRAVMGNSWEEIRESDIQILLQDYRGPIMDRDDEVTRAFEDLRTTYSQSHTISAFESKIYCEAITDLIWVYNSCPPDGTTDGRQITRIVTTWPIKMSAEYAEMLNQRKPEALVIMAYFSILMYQLRDFWAVGDAGKLLLNSVEAYLGEEWREWLIVPKRFIGLL